MHNYLPAFICHLLPCKQQLVPCSPQIPENSSLKDSQIGTSLVRLYKQFRACCWTIITIWACNQPAHTGFSTTWFLSNDKNRVKCLTVSWSQCDLLSHDMNKCYAQLYSLHWIVTPSFNLHWGMWYTDTGGFGSAPTPSPPYAARSSEDYLLTHWKIPLATGRKPLA